MALEISRRDIDAIIDLMGIGNGVVFYDENYNRPGQIPFSPSIVMPSGFVPLFWISVATFYCEVEHQLSGSVPAWTPEDLATQSYITDYSHSDNYVVVLPPHAFKVVA